MTDDEIIKALKHCGNVITSSCKDCPFHHIYNADCVRELMHNALDLINRQKAEIERLQEEHNEDFEKWEILDKRTKERYAELYEEAKQTAKSEAIKEFAERLKEKSEHFWEEKENFVSEEDIDNLVKEMTEVQE